VAHIVTPAKPMPSPEDIEVKEVSSGHILKLIY
jgi:hypothetical protein